jgi:CubicO group peptidase (beta-lactamase class C family)
MAKATKFETLNGFPRETITLANWRTRPYSFWAFRNVAEMVRSARIRTAAPSPLPAKVDSRDLLARPASPGASQPVADLLRSSQADSFLLSRNGRLVCEWHADGVDRSDPHLVFSISKSITALVAGILEDQGLLDPSTPVGKLVPEAGNSAYADATVQHLLDMRVSLDFDESYLSQLDYARYRRAMSWNPPSPEGGDEAMLSFLCSLRKAPGDHGGDHTYLSPNSDMLGIVLERISGERFPDLCSRLLWQPLGATADAFITVDPEGAPRTAGGSPAGRMICWRSARCWSMAATSTAVKSSRNAGSPTCRRTATRMSGRAAPRPVFSRQAATATTGIRSAADRTRFSPRASMDSFSIATRIPPR